MPIQHSNFVGFTNFRNATLKEICAYLSELSHLSNSFIQWTEKEIQVSNLKIPEWAQNDRAHFLHNAGSQFVYYRDELARLSKEMMNVIEDRHLAAVKSVWAEAKDFDESCISFKNNVALRAEGNANYALVELYAGVRDRNSGFLDLMNILPRIRLLRTDAPVNAELLSLKPEFYGISFDLKLFFSKLGTFLKSVEI